MLLRSGRPGPLGLFGVATLAGVGGDFSFVNGEGLAREKTSNIERFFTGRSGVGYGFGLLVVSLLDLDIGSVGATMTRYCVVLSPAGRPSGTNV